MEISASQKLNAVSLKRLISQAEQAEFCKDWKLSKEILSPIWSNIDDEPDIKDFDIISRGHLLRLCGTYLCLNGKGKNKKTYQERARNYISEAITIFENARLKDPAGEAYIFLAATYFFEGSIDEFEMILANNEKRFNNNELNSVYLRTVVNRLLALKFRGKIAEGIKIIEDIAVIIELCNHQPLQLLYHSQAGMFYRASGQFAESFQNYEKAIELSEKLNNIRSVGLNLNNLANLFADAGDFAKSHELLDQAEKIFVELNENGWLAHVIDSRCSILIRERKYQLALKTIDKAIKIFSAGEDFLVLADALILRIQCLFALKNINEAFLTFSKLSNIVTYQIGEDSMGLYAEKMSELSRQVFGGSLDDKVSNFKKIEIITALKSSKLSIASAAAKLNLSEMELAKILDNEFPEIYETLGISPTAYKNTENDQFIKWLYLKTGDLEFAGDCHVPDISKVSMFYVSRSLMELYQIDFDVILAAKPALNIEGETVYLIQTSELKVYFAVLKYEELSGFNIFVDCIDPHNEFLLEDVQVIGKPFAFCPITLNDKFYFEAL